MDAEVMLCCAFTVSVLESKAQSRKLRTEILNHENQYMRQTQSNRWNADVIPVLQLNYSR